MTREWMVYTPPRSTSTGRNIPVQFPAASGSEIAAEGGAQLMAGQISFDTLADDITIGGALVWRQKTYKVDSVTPIAEMRHVWHRVTASTRR